MKKIADENANRARELVAEKFARKPTMKKEQIEVGKLDQGQLDQFEGNMKKLDEENKRLEEDVLQLKDDIKNEKENCKMLK